VLVTNGADAETLAALRAAAEAAGATVEIIAPVVGGVDVSDGSRVPAGRDFVTDAVAHCKFIGYTSGAAVLFEAAGLPMDPATEDDGFISLSEHPAAEFIARCGQLRHWDRELATVR